MFCKMRYLIGEGKLMRYKRYVKKEGLWEYSIKGKQFFGLLPPQGFRPEGEILKRHSSNLCVY